MSIFDRVFSFTCLCSHTKQEGRIVFPLSRFCEKSYRHFCHKEFSQPLHRQLPAVGPPLWGEGLYAHASEDVVARSRLTWKEAEVRRTDEGIAEHSSK